MCSVHIHVYIDVRVGVPGIVYDTHFDTYSKYCILSFGLLDGIGKICFTYVRMIMF